MDACWRHVGDGVQVVVRLTPRGGRDELGRVEMQADGRRVLSARVRAAPSDGEANAALVRLLAKSLRHPASRIAITHGATSRIKTVLIEGAGEEVIQRLGELTG